MSGLRIDTEVAASDAHDLAAWGDAFDKRRYDIEAAAEQLMLAEASPAVEALGWAAAELWTVATYLLLLVQHVEQADRPGADRSLSITQLMRLAGDATTRRFSPMGGDLGGTFAGELRSPYLIVARSQADRGREVLARALRDLASVQQIHPDEIAIVQLGDRYLVALPGVTDLRDFDLGWNGRNRTVRDLDQAAVPSFLLASTPLSILLSMWPSYTPTDRNRYASQVADALAARGVPLGSEVIIVGHSAGAGTGIDLAADPAFNGPDGYRVTHVLAAGYDSEPLLDEVPESTKVLVINNSLDVVEQVEEMGDGFPWKLQWNLAEGYGRDLVVMAGGVASANPAVVARSARDLIRLDARTERQSPSHTVVVFDGGSEGAGHHQNNYVEYLLGTDEPAVVEFMESVGTDSAIGPAYAIDVSVPE